MAYYRLYFFGGPGGRIDHFREFECDDDFAAVRLAAKWRRTDAMELWSRARRVRKWDHLTPRATSLRHGDVLTHQ